MEQTKGNGGEEDVGRDHYWTEIYKAALRKGDYRKRMMASAALRELDGIEDKDYE